jgi:hypothetical protein
MNTSATKSIISGRCVSGRDRERIGALKSEIEQLEDGRYIIFYTFED